MKICKGIYLTVTALRKRQKHRSSSQKVRGSIRTYDKSAKIRENKNCEMNLAPGSISFSSKRTKGFELSHFQVEDLMIFHVNNS